MVADADPGVRRHAAEQIQRRDLWPLLIYPRAPLAVIASVLERFADLKMEEYGQICLECVFSRLTGFLDHEAPRRANLEAFRAVLHQFARFRFSADARSFERLEMLMELYRRRDPDGGGETSLSWKELVASGGGEELQEGRTLEFLGSLPLVVQRHLARQGLHVEYFACHPDFRVAKETRPYLVSGRARIVMLLKSMNGRLFYDLLQEPRLFRTPSELEAVLRHPKCDPSFAAKNLARLGRPGLIRIVRDRGANRQVRDQAERLAKVRGFHGRERRSRQTGAAGG